MDVIVVDFLKEENSWNDPSIDHNKTRIYWSYHKMENLLKFLQGE